MTDQQSPIPGFEGAVCPVPLRHSEHVVLGHGSGGKMSHDLITSIFLPPFDNPALNAGNDAAVVLPSRGNRLAISTDSHVVSPLFFPGGDIGKLAVCGTVNDISMMGARPLYLTASFILEEGLDMDILRQVAASMQSAALEAGVQIVAGDTKVVQKGKADGLYITTSGVGIIRAEIDISGSNAKPGDAVIISGPLGDHGIAVLGARGELGFITDVVSDTAPLNHLVDAMLEINPESAHVLRDPTRGGLATTLNEIARQSEVGIYLYEESIPVRPAVSAACEMLGFDPLYVANEGRLVAIIQQEYADEILAAMRSTRYGEQAAVIGEVRPDPTGRVLMKTVIGSTRVVDILAGEMLPRIC